MDNIAKTNGKDAFAATAPAWHGLGQIVENAMTADQALELGGLGFTVEKAPIHFNLDGTQIDIEDKYATYRSDTNIPLGIVGKNYKIVQNADAFEFFDAIVGDTNVAMYETVGALGNGERIFITAKMPEEINIGGHDRTQVYVLLSTSHDGSGAVVGAITPVRVVCNNTLNAALGAAKKKVYIRHTTNAQAKLADAHKVLDISHKFVEETQSILEKMATKKVSDASAIKLIEELFPSPEEAEASTRLKNIRDEVWQSYKNGIGQEGIKGTAYGFYNGIAYFFDHTKEYKDDRVKFLNVMEGDGSKVLQKTADLLLDI